MNNLINKQRFIVKILSDKHIRFICKNLQLKILVIAKDELYTTKFIRNGLYILNLADRHSITNGTHWTTLIIRGNDAIYFDSMGEVYPIDVCDFCNKHKLNLIRTHLQIQTLDTVSCGWYCIFFLYYMLHNKNNVHECIRTFCKLFNNIYQLENNEKKLHALFIKYCTIV